MVVWSNFLSLVVAGWKGLRTYRHGNFVADGLVFLWVNFKHYSHALFGFRCAFLPDAPELMHFFYPTIYQSVLEYRGYVLVAPFCACFVAALNHFAPDHASTIAGVFSGLWLSRSIFRAASFRSPFAFWRQLFYEGPFLRKHPRILMHFGQFIADEMAARMKRGDRVGYAALISLGEDVQYLSMRRTRYGSKTYRG